MAMNLNVGGVQWLRDDGQGGQMTVELVAVLPVALLIAAITVNALVFFGDCAAFDRVARNAVRVYAASPTYGVQAAQSASSIASTVKGEFSSEFEEVAATFEGVGGGLVRYTVTLDYAPNLFGMGVRASLFGVDLPHLRHSTSLVVDAYKPGVFFD